MNRILLAAAILGYVACAQNTEWEKPSFCNGNDCPVFDVLETGNGYELRRYQPGKWVTTMYWAMTDEETNQKNSEAFRKLFRYIDGDNENSEKIDMTAPVITKVIPGTGPNCKSQFFQSFYITWAKQDSAPQPINQEVYLEDLPEMDVYTRSFDGYATRADYIANIMALSEAIGDSNLYDKEYFYTAGYDGPNKWWDRHNESWLVKKQA